MVLKTEPKKKKKKRKSLTKAMCIKMLKILKTKHPKALSLPNWSYRSQIIQFDIKAFAYT